MCLLICTLLYIIIIQKKELCQKNNSFVDWYSWFEDMLRVDAIPEVNVSANKCCFSGKTKTFSLQCV